MSRVQIVTDSDAQIEPQVAQQLEINVVPLTVEIDGERYRDVKGERNEELLIRMAAERVQPHVVGPTAADFRTIYTRLAQLSDQIVSIHSSTHMSDIVRNARAAASEFLGRCDIVIVDSQTTSMGLAILATTAATMAQEGRSREDILRVVRGMIPRIYVVLFTNSLDYLERSGRISPAQCILGTMLDVKPFLSIEDGEIIPMEKVRSRDKGVDKLVEFAGEFSAIEQATILQHVSFPTDETVNLRDRLHALFPGDHFPVQVYGPLLASHIGPDALGLVIYEGDGND